MKKLRISALVIFTASLMAFSVSAKDKNSNKNKAVKTEAPISLESNFIGDKEQPAVSYFIPWNEVGTPDKLQWNIGSKRDKTLSVVDRDIMLRTTNVYNELQLEKKAVLKSKD